jgi:hypothetical protein
MAAKPGEGCAGFAFSAEVSDVSSGALASEAATNALRIKSLLRKRMIDSLTGQVIRKGCGIIGRWDVACPGVIHEEFEPTPITCSGQRKN